MYFWKSFISLLVYPNPIHSLAISHFHPSHFGVIIYCIKVIVDFAFDLNIVYAIYQAPAFLVYKLMEVINLNFSTLVRLSELSLHVEQNPILVFKAIKLTTD